MGAGLLFLAGGYFAWLWWRPAPASSLIALLPAGDSIVVYVDFATLRKAGLLDKIAGEADVEEAEYKKFADATGFRYRADLDAVALASSAEGNFLAVRGRFQRGRIESYVRAQGGSCEAGACALPGSEPGRWTSLRFLDGGLLAAASSSDRGAARRIGQPPGLRGIPAPDSSAWLYLPASWAAQAENRPLLWRRIGEALGGARYAVFAFRALPTPRIEMSAPAESESTAQSIVERWTGLTRTAGAFDWLPSFVSQGRFRREGASAFGEWPVVLQP